VCLVNANQAQGFWARYFNAYRLAAYFLVLYALGHTFGAVVTTPDFGPQSAEVVASMKTVHVAAQGSDCTWYGFYTGFGYFVSIFFVFSVVMAWHVGGKTREQRIAFLPLSWTLVACYGVSVVTGVLYFFRMPILFSTVVTLLLGFACVGDERARRAVASAQAAHA
jgi:hypothetical protein